MTHTKAITPARQAMLDLINSKKQARTSTNSSSYSLSTAVPSTTQRNFFFEASVKKKYVR